MPDGSAYGAGIYQISEKNSLPLEIIATNICDLIDYNKHARTT